MESILIFGGGLNQLTLIKSAIDLGYRTIVIDPNPEAPAKNIAHAFETVGPKDYDKTKEVAIKYNVKGIVTCQMENPLLLMAKLAKELNYLFPTEEAILNARNKQLMKSCFIKNNVPCAKGVLVKSGEVINRELCEQIGFPLIIKPVDSFSSRGVYKINSFDEIEKYIQTTKSFASNGDVLVEEFMEGPEVSVESVTQNGITTVVQITDKVITSYPTAVEMAHIQPSELSEDSKNKITALVKEAATALKIDNCGGHAEVKVTAKGVKMVEMGARLGGDYITSHLVPLSTGVNIEAAVIQIAMGKEPNLEHKYQRAALIEYLRLPEGRTIAKIGNWREILSNESVKQANIFLKENDVVPAVTDSAKRSGYIIVEGMNRRSAINAAEENRALIEKKIEFKQIT